MKTRFTEEQIIRTLSRLKKGEKAKDLGREIGVSGHTIYNWRMKYNDMTVNEAKRLRELELENSRLKRLVAEQALDIVMLKDVNSKKW
ncbi:MAG: transposase [Bdellovibrionales bacterium]